MSTDDFDAWFARATGNAPFPYQRALAHADPFPTQLQAPTGAGKTAAVTLAWLWRRRFAAPDVRAATPRRLVWCLPMRTLVEQTAQVISGWLGRLGLGDIDVDVLLGGAVAAGLEGEPEADRVIVGTQDLLLSRALNRGYAMAPTRWPMAFGLLNTDCLWACDEVQLMGVGLSTAAQLDALRHTWPGAGPQHTLYLSATLDQSRLDTIDRKAQAHHALTLSAADRDHGDLGRRWRASKPIAPVTFAADDIAAFAAEVCSTHRPGTRTLVVVNQVKRAQALYRRIEQDLRRAGDPTPIHLLHSRFRAGDRALVLQRVLAPGGEGIVVASQVVEAGVDLSARALFTDLAPYDAMVQRFGRCNRRGEYTDAMVRWVDLADADAGPYEAAALTAARQRLSGLADVAPMHLPEGDAAGIALPVIRARDVRALFDTTPDLSGADLDVSAFVRDAADSDLFVAWRSVPTDAPRQLPAETPAIQRSEICRVSIARLAPHLKPSLAKPQQRLVWRLDVVSGCFVPVGRERLTPGMTLLLDLSVGGYDALLGYTGDPSHRPAPIETEAIFTVGDESDPLSHGSRDYVTLKLHAEDTAAAMAELLQGLDDRTMLTEVLQTAARWHDLGKVHPVFQRMLVKPLSPEDERRQQGPWAKSDQRRGGTPCERRGFRHELASALAWLQHHPEHPARDLIAYLVAAHHGKVRTTLRPQAHEQAPSDGRAYVHGVWQGDRLPAVDLGGEVQVAESRLDLDVARLGASPTGAPSWAARVAHLLAEHGPFRLAWLETLVRVADWRASARRATRPAQELTDG